MYVHDLILRAEALYGNLPAVVDGPVRYRYAELAGRVRRLAGGLRALGLGPGDVVACLSLNGHRAMESFFAASLAGVAVTPINTRLAPPETAFILRDSGAKALLAGASFLPALERIAGEVPDLKHVVLLDGPAGRGASGSLSWRGYEEWLAASQPWREAPADWATERMVLLCYTGGTTGLPKGVMLSQGNVLANARHAIEMMELGGRDVWLHAAPMFHLADAWACFSITALGGLHVFMERFDAAQALALIEAHAVTATSIVPTMVLMLLQEPSVATRNLRSLRRVLYGASPMPVAPLKAAIERFGPILQQAYGQTESAPFLATTPARDLGFPATEAGLRRLASCGQPIFGAEVRIVASDGRLCAPGEVGEIQARGPNVMLGYWQRPQETQAALAGGWLHTGDLAYADADGYLFIVDRAKDVIIRGGENIYSSEVENALYRHPTVLEAAVIGVSDERWGETVRAVVVLRPGAHAAEAELIAHCQELIARFKCPQSVEFRAELPKSGAGKILKAELRKPFRAARPAG